MADIIKLGNNGDYDSYPTVFINLVDAIRAYLAFQQTLGLELLHEGAITRAELEQSIAEDAPLATWLARNINHGIDPTLGGAIKDQSS